MAKVEVIHRLEMFQPKSWDELATTLKYINTLSSTIKAQTRSEFQEARYHKRKEEARLKGEPLSHQIRRELNGRTTAVLINPYPYDNLILRLNQNLTAMGYEVVHLNVWSTEGELSDEGIRAVLDGVPGLEDACYCVNGDQLQTIGDLWHCQVFALVRQEAIEANTGLWRDYRKLLFTAK